jgi:hypothetical protein
MCCPRSGSATPGLGARGEGHHPKPAIGRGPTGAGLAEATLWSEHSTLGRYVLRSPPRRPPGCSSPRTRPTPVPCTARVTRAVHEGRLPRRVVRRRSLGHQPRRAGHQGGAAAPRGPGGRPGRLEAAPASRRRQARGRPPSAPPSTTVFARDGVRPTSSTQRRPPGLRRAALEQAVLPLRREGLARGRPGHPPPPASAGNGRNRDWPHLYNRDVISMPDKWEYPWYAAWDLAFHMIPFAEVDPDFAKDQLLLFLREWYMHPNGQIPAYEWAFGDVNPPVHAWACWRVYKMTAPRRGSATAAFLARVLPEAAAQLHLVGEPQGPDGRNLFSRRLPRPRQHRRLRPLPPLPTGGHLEQADGTAWMAFYCGTMLSIALELAATTPPTRTWPPSSSSTSSPSPTP